MSEKQKVLVRLVAEWRCPECDHLNHMRGNALSDDTAEIAAEHGEDPADLCELPAILYCRKCEQGFEPESQGGEDAIN